MSPVLTRPRSRLQLSSFAGLAAWVVLALGPLLIGGRMTAGEPSFVAGLTVVNPLVYKVNVHARAAEDDGWSDLGTVRRETAKTIEQVVDQGALWTFRFTYGGEVGGEVTRRRDQLEADRWSVTVPADVGDRLRQAGLRPSAP